RYRSWWGTPLSSPRNPLRPACCSACASMFPEAVNYDVPQCMRHIGQRGTAIDGIDKAGSEQPQRRLIQRSALFTQGKYLLGPVAFAGEPGKVHGECRVFPAPGQPGAVVDQAQAAQGFDQWQLARIEVMELVITVDQLGQL